jgi:hypothetical protein
MNFDKTLDDINEIIIQWIRLATENADLTIISAEGEGVTPTGEYCTIYIYNATSIGMGATAEELLQGWEQIDLHQSQLVKYTMSVIFNRGNAHDYARKVLNFPNTNKSRNFLFDKNLSINVPNTFRVLDEAISGKRIQRANVDLSLISNSKYVETVNVIDEVDINVSSS